MSVGCSALQWERAENTAQQQRQGERCIETGLPAIQAVPYVVGHYVLPA